MWYTYPSYSKDFRLQSHRGNDYSFLEDLLAAWHGEHRITASVVLTTFNMKHLVEKTLCGLRLQTYPSDLFEIIISDDGSSDGIEELVKENEKYFSHLYYITQEHNGYRLATIRNNGIKYAKNEVIVLLDGDVLPVPELLEYHLRWFHIFEDLAVIGYIRYVDTSFLSTAEILADFEKVQALPNYPSISNWGRKHDRRLPEFENFKHHPFPFNCFHGGNVSFKRQQALNIGLFDEDFNGNWGYEDLEFGHRLWQNDTFFIPEPAALGLHQERDNLTLEEKQRQRNINFEKICLKIPGFREFRQQIAR